nr:hypothetical protein [Candidatus Sigynarchaeum springense]
MKVKAAEMGIVTTSAGIVFIIEKLDDFIVAMEQFRSLFYTASDLAGRIPDDLDIDKINENSSWLKPAVP